MITTEYGRTFNRSTNLNNFKKTQKGVIYTEVNSTGPDLKILLCTKDSLGTTKVCFSDDFHYHVFSFRRHVKNYKHPMTPLMPTPDDMQFLWTLKLSTTGPKYSDRKQIVVPLFFNAIIL